MSSVSKGVPTEASSVLNSLWTLSRWSFTFYHILSTAHTSHIHPCGGQTMLRKFIPIIMQPTEARHQYILVSIHWSSALDMPHRLLEHVPAAVTLLHAHDNSVQFIQFMGWSWQFCACTPLMLALHLWSWHADWTKSKKAFDFETNGSFITSGMHNYRSVNTLIPSNKFALGGPICHDVT